MIKAWQGWIGALILWGIGVSSVHAQLREIPEAVRQVYKALPKLPLENTYAPKADNIGSPQDNTWIRRVMLYHIQLKGRSPTSRLDWKLTLADYLGANETMFTDAYPGATTYSPNPYDGDLKVMQSLSRAERNALLLALLNAFGGDPTPPTLYIPPVTATEAPSLAPTPAKTALPKPGGAADLLKP